MATAAAMGFFGSPSAAAKSFPPPVGKIPSTTSRRCAAFTSACSVPSPPIASSTRRPAWIALRAYDSSASVLSVKMKSAGNERSAKIRLMGDKHLRARPPPACGLTNTAAGNSRDAMQNSATAQHMLPKGHCGVNRIWKAWQRLADDREGAGLAFDYKSWPALAVLARTISSGSTTMDFG